MPTAEYEHRSDSVLAWKRAQKLGRFDPDAPSIEQQKIRASEREVEERGKRYFLFCSPGCGSYGCGEGGQQKQIYYHRRRCSCLPYLLSQHAKRRCFKRFPNWTAAHLLIRRCHTSTSKGSYVSSRNHIRTREVAQHTSNLLNHESSYPNPTSKLPLRASCI
jgi:hypothetical protein